MRAKGAWRAPNRGFALVVDQRNACSATPITPPTIYTRGTKCFVAPRQCQR